MKQQFKKLGLICALCALTAVVGFGVQNLQAASAENLAPDFQDSGASVRVDKDGVRFTFSVDESYKDAGYTYGTLIIPKKVLGNNVLNHNNDAADAVTLSYEHVAQTKWATEAYAALKAEDETHFYEEGREYFNAVLSEIPQGFYGTTLVARSYAVKDGVYYYSDPVERSIAQVAAAALNNGETGDKLTEYVDTALVNKTLSMNATNVYVATGSEQTLDVVNGNGYKAIWTSSNNDVATVKDGKVTAVAAGKATITAKLGTATVTSNVQVGAALEGEKIVDLTAENYGSYITAVKDGDGNGACNITVNSAVQVAGSDVIGLKVTSYYGRIRFTFPGLEYMKYEKVQFYAYVSGDDKQQVTGAGVLKNETWTKAEVEIDRAKNYVDITFNNKDWNSNNGGAFYVSNFYGVNPTGFTKVMDFIAEDDTSILTQTAGDGTPDYTTAQALPGESGSLLVTVPKANSYAHLQWKSSSILTGYNFVQSKMKFEKLAIAVYLDESESSRKGTAQMITFAGAQATLTPNAWTWLVVDAPVTLGDIQLKDTNNEAWKSTGMKFYLSDLYALNPQSSEVCDFNPEGAEKVCDFNAENVNKISYNSYGNNGKGTGAVLDSIGGALCGTVKGNFVDTFFNASYVDLTGYKQITFAVYTAGSPRTLNVYNGGSIGSNGAITTRTAIKSFTLTQGSWTTITIDIPEGVTDLDGLSLRMYETSWNSRVTAGEIYMISDIYGIK